MREIYRQQQLPIHENHNQTQQMKMKQSQIFLGAIVLTLGILSASPGVRATEPMDGGTNGNTTGEPFEGAGIDLPPFAQARI